MSTRPTDRPKQSALETTRVIRALLVGALELLPDDRRGATSALEPANTSNSEQLAVVAQFHAAEYASERNSVDVWKTLQYALIPIMFGAWYLLQEVRNALPDQAFRWACAAVVPLCYVAYQKAMVDALTGIQEVEGSIPFGSTSASLRSTLAEPKLLGRRAAP